MKINQSQSLIGGTIAFLIATSCCWLPFLVIGLGGASSIVAFSAGLEKFSGLFMIVGAGFLSWGGYQFYQKNNKTTMNNTIQLQSVITCPVCNFSKAETMPTNACQFFYECENCKKVLKPKKGDCCVYCSYGTVACPPIQEGKNCC